MITIHHAVEVPYPVHAMYVLVNDISAYPEFIPFCTVGTMTPVKENEVRGTLTFSGLGIVESFVTHNILRPPDEIQMRLLEGPFKHLAGGWKFIALSENRTQVEFSLQFEFEFSNTWVDYILQPIFSTLSYNAMKVFLEHANACYGEPTTDEAISHAV